MVSVLIGDRVGLSRCLTVSGGVDKKSNGKLTVEGEDRQKNQLKTRFVFSYLIGEDVAKSNRPTVALSLVNRGKSKVEKN